MKKTLFGRSSPDLLESVLNLLVKGNEEIEQKARSEAAKEVFSKERRIETIWKSYFTEYTAKGPVAWNIR